MWCHEDNCERCENTVYVTEHKISVTKQRYLEHQTPVYRFRTRCAECGKVIDIPEFMISSSAKKRMIDHYESKQAI